MILSSRSLAMSPGAASSTGAGSKRPSSQSASRAIAARGASPRRARAAVPVAAPWYRGPPSDCACARARSRVISVKARDQQLGAREHALAQAPRVGRVLQLLEALQRRILGEIHLREGAQQLLLGDHALEGRELAALDHALQGAAARADQPRRARE